jgi:hypothetical protein
MIVDKEVYGGAREVTVDDKNYKRFQEALVRYLMMPGTVKVLLQATVEAGAPGGAGNNEEVLVRYLMTSQSQRRMRM